MAYLIDGHNLIAAVPGIHLDEIDDETQLIQVLGGFCRQRKKRVEVFFDNAPPGQPRECRPWGFGPQGPGKERGGCSIGSPTAPAR